MDEDVKIANEELGKIARRKKKPKPANETRRSSAISPFMSMQQVLEVVPISRSTLYLMISNDEFPKQIKLGKRTAVWSKSDVQKWIDDKLGV